MPNDRIRVKLVRTGGFGGIRRTARVDTEELDKDRAEELRRLITEADLARGDASHAPTQRAAKGADRFLYEVTLVSHGDQRTVVVDESDASEGDQRLVRWVLAEGSRPQGAPQSGDE